MLNKYKVEDLTPLESGSRIMGPDFIGIGTPKSGTSWWYKCLLEHPQVRENRLRRKELTYFQHIGMRQILEKEIQDYRNIFSVSSDQIVGEWSPGYMFYPFCIDNISIAVPDVKILVLLRNPVDRLLSQYNMLIKQRAGYFNLDKDKEYILKTFSLLPEAFNSGLYSHYLEIILKKIRKSNLKILIYENCVQSPLTYIKDTYRFLGIDDTYEPVSAFKMVNKSGEYNTGINYEYKLLRNYFEDDVKALQNLLPDLDVSEWGYTNN